MTTQEGIVKFVNLSNIDSFTTPDNISIKTLKLRVKDKHAKVLRQMAREVNQVWSF